jgi:hypothetical protein
MADEIAVVEKKFFDTKQLIQKWFHSRKIAIYLAVLLVGTIGLFLRLLDGGQWTDLAKWSSGAYMTANALDGIGDGIAGRK